VDGADRGFSFHDSHPARGPGEDIVCEIFKTLGVKIYNADLNAKHLLDNNMAVKNKVTETFGEEIYRGGEADRKLLAKRVFNNPEALNKLNAIIHPAVSADFDFWLKQNQNEPYVLKEAAILFESGAFKHLDAVVMVYAPAELRLKRVIARDKADPESVISRMKNQMDEEEKLKRSNYVIYNDESQSLIRQVLHLHHIFIKN
jgi:dephospho-CoA kinase